LVETLQNYFEQTYFAKNFNLPYRMAPGVGFEPSPDSRETSLTIATLSFLRSYFPFFSFFNGSKVLAKESLAGDERYESKSSQLPLLWQVLARRSLEWEKPNELGECCLSSMWWAKSLERRKTIYKFRSVATLSVQRLCPSFFTLVAILFVFFPFFFVFMEAFC
jgi:hypothetical protein